MTLTFWFDQLIEFKEQILMRVVPTLSEVWKGEDPKVGLQGDKQIVRTGEGWGCV